MKELIIQVPDNFGRELKPEKVNFEIVGELIRCNDCIHWYRQTCRYHVIAMPQEDDNGFCEKAIRKK